MRRTNSRKGGALTVTKENFDPRSPLANKPVTILKTLQVEDGGKDDGSLGRNKV
jgi:hypothetical protein